MRRPQAPGATDTLEAYSPERRTALVLTGTGLDGAYHAGVLRALDEAGVKIDLVCGRGIGVIGALFTAVDGAARLWDPGGLWRPPAVAGFYRWRWPLRLVWGTLATAAAAIALPLLLFAIALLVYPLGFLLGMVGLELGARLITGYAQTVDQAFRPEALPAWLPRLVTALALCAFLLLLGESVIAWSRMRSRPRRRGNRAWALIGAPLDASTAANHFTHGLWELLRGGASRTPKTEDLSGRFCDRLVDNLGQPGFREILLVVHDLDARQDVLFAMLKGAYKRGFFGARGGDSRRPSEAFDLGGAARDHVGHILRAALTVPGASSVPLLPFGADTFWRGERHRLTDRPAALERLLEETARAGAEQVVIVSAAAAPPHPHELLAPRVDARGHLGEQSASAETASLRDAQQHLQDWFKGAWTIRPAHNPALAFDFDAPYDERSDRAYHLRELVERGYEDAYRDFIEPVVGASGERMAGSLDHG